jgi:hypothetical protein
VAGIGRRPYRAGMELLVERARRSTRVWLAAYFLAVLLALAFVWPTRFAYFGTYRDGFIRVHRVSGRAELLTSEGWEPLRPNPFTALREQRPIPKP